MDLEEFIEWYRDFDDAECVDMQEVYTIYFNQEIYGEHYDFTA